MKNCIFDSQKLMEELSTPFELQEIEWRVQTAIEKNNGYRILIVPYITSRTVLNRLDKVCGGFWQSHFDKIEVNKQEAFQCRMSIKIGDEWITRTDASEVSDIESVKGGHSNALKRAGAQWGIGRYIYDLRNIWVDLKQRGQHSFSGNFKVKNSQVFLKGYFDTPPLPEWAKPLNKRNEPTPKNQPVNQSPNVPVEQSQQQPQTNSTKQPPRDLEFEALELVNGLLEYLKVPQEYIPSLLKKSGGATVELEQSSREDLGKLYHTLEPVYRYVKACKKFNLDDRGMIYFAQIVLRVQLENIFSLFLKMDKKSCEAAILLMTDDMKNTQVS